MNAYLAPKKNTDFVPGFFSDLFPILQHKKI